MYRRWSFVVGLVVALVVVGLLVMGGLAAYRAGWTQGSLSSSVEERGEGSLLAPSMPYGFRHPGRHFGFLPFGFSVLGLFFRFGLLLLVIGLVARALFFRPWRMAGMPSGRRRARRWHPPHGPMHPWDWYGPREDEPADAEADAGPDDAETEK